MGFGEAVKTCFRKYFGFSGRATRPEYWWFFLFLVIGSIVFSIIDIVAFGIDATIQPLTNIFSLGTLFPSIAVAARRLHDTNRSGWWQLIPLAPLPLLLLAIPGYTAGTLGGLAIVLITLVILAVLVLSVLLIVWLATKGNDGSNRFGEDPF